jgi:aldose 1-epimerase
MTTITKAFFDKDKLSRDVYAYTLTDGDFSAVILDRGGIIKNLYVPNKQGGKTDVVLGYDTMAGYDNNDGYLSALIGRFGNRIGKGQVRIDGVNYQLYCNDKTNHLHGGKDGFDKKIWKAEIVKMENGNERLALSILSPDGEENYPGNLTVKVVYSLEDGVLTIDYEAVSDKTTLINLTNHAYFNLDGSDDILGHLMTMYAPNVLPTDNELIPHGDFRATTGTPFDFLKEKTIASGDKCRAEDPDLAVGGGFDHCFVFDKNRDLTAPYAIVRSEKSGITMKCYTDMPAVHFYAGNYLNQTGKGGKFYGRCAGFCLETEALPNNPNVPAYAEYGSSVYESGKVYRFSAKYSFK